MTKTRNDMLRATRAVLGAQMSGDAGVLTRKNNQLELTSSMESAPRVADTLSNFSDPFPRWSIEEDEED